MSSHWSDVATQTQHYFNRLGVFLNHRQAKIAGALMYYNRPISPAVLSAVMEERYTPPVSERFLNDLRDKLKPVALKVERLEDGRYCALNTDKLPDLPPIHIVAKTLLLALAVPMLVMTTANAIAAL